MIKVKKEGLFLIVSSDGHIEKITTETTNKKGIIEEWRICQKKHSDENVLQQHDCKIFRIVGEEVKPPILWENIIRGKGRDFIAKK